MTFQDDMTTAQRCLDDLARCVNRLEQQVGNGLEIRRLRSDADHLRESLALLRAAAGAEPSPGPGQDMVTISDAPYDSALWTDAEDEGLGARDRRAP